MGIIPPDAELTARHEEIPAWKDMPAELQPVLARQMEVYAGFLEHTDFHIGRLVDAISDLEVLDDTLVFYIIGDNGASAEGTINRTFNELLMLNGASGLETPEYLAARMDAFGTPAAYNHYAVGWAHAMCTPYQWAKQVASQSSPNASVTRRLRTWTTSSRPRSASASPWRASRPAAPRRERPRCPGPVTALPGLRPGGQCTHTRGAMRRGPHSGRRDRAEPLARPTRRRQGGCGP